MNTIDKLRLIKKKNNTPTSEVKERIALLILCILKILLENYLKNPVEIDKFWEKHVM